MNLIATTTRKLSGTAAIPGSKSHTIRAVIIGSLAAGVSRIRKPLVSADTLAVVKACRALGAEISLQQEEWTIRGCAGKFHAPAAALNLENSGTSLALLAGVVSLFPFPVIFDGDASLRSRPMEPLLSAVEHLGVRTSSERNDGKCPFTMTGPLLGGKTRVNGLSSQYISALLLAAPLAPKETVVNVDNPHEIPYIRMTLRWLASQEINIHHASDFTRFVIPGNQHYKAFERDIPADWSSAAFPLVAGAVTDSDILLTGPDRNDVQGDKEIVKYLQTMGADIRTDQDGIRVRGRALHGTSLDLNATPDALPILAVAACFADGVTNLRNVTQARIKETDRITVMTKELSALGASIKELPDGLEIHRSPLRGATVNGHGDHRVVMALAVAGLFAEGETIVTTAESAGVTFPGFVDLMRNLGANISTREEGGKQAEGNENR